MYVFLQFAFFFSLNLRQTRKMSDKLFEMLVCCHRFAPIANERVLWRCNSGFSPNTNARNFQIVFQIRYSGGIMTCRWEGEWARFGTKSSRFDIPDGMKFCLLNFIEMMGPPVSTH